MVRTNFGTWDVCVADEMASGVDGIQNWMSLELRKVICSTDLGLLYAFV